MKFLVIFAMTVFSLNVLAMEGTAAEGYGPNHTHEKVGLSATICNERGTSSKNIVRDVASAEGEGVLNSDDR